LGKLLLRVDPCSPTPLTVTIGSIPHPNSMNINRQASALRTAPADFCAITVDGHALSGEYQFHYTGTEKDAPGGLACEE